MSSCRARAKTCTHTPFFRLRLGSLASCVPHGESNGLWCRHQFVTVVHLGPGFDSRPCQGRVWPAHSTRVGGGTLQGMYVCLSVCPSAFLTGCVPPPLTQTSPVLDVCAVLRSCVRRRRTVLTVPWVVEFLSMLDFTGPFLQCYRQALCLLLHLYRYHTQCSAALTCSSVWYHIVHSVAQR